MLIRLATTEHRMQWLKFAGTKQKLLNVKVFL